YKPHRDASPEESKLLLALARLIEKADAAEFRQKIGDYLDLDKFLRYLAVTAMLVNLDSPLAMPQNFFIYLPAKSKKAVFLPWDLDLTFAAWPMGGSPEQQMNLSLLHPHAGEHKLIERLLADEEVRARYLKIIKDLSATSFTESELLTRIDKVENAIKDPRAKEAKALAARNETDAAHQAGQIAAHAPSLRDFAVKRPASIQSQLKNLETGYVPMGMGGPPGGGPHLPRSLLAKLDQLRNSVDRLQKSGKPTLPIEEKLQRFGPLLRAGKFVEAEALLDQVLLELKKNK
ncbi:MAG TPA: CotH kinase family protein, partial [Candidatus Eisenbacteria bacterium]|nr:CotH kinase family protein [Candidatus Eisenbacteria bacterium]